MSKMTLQDLAAVLVAKNELDEDKADQFVKTFFDILTTGMQQDKSVKIKGLGTFKVVEVEPRESINVNTGERLVIEGHDKINFIPEKGLKMLVNKPFEQFETVVLNEKTDFSGLENMDGLLENLDDDPFATDIDENASTEDHSKCESDEQKGEINVDDVEEEDEPIHIISEHIISGSNEGEDNPSVVYQQVQPVEQTSSTDTTSAAKNSTEEVPQVVSDIIQESYKQDVAEQEPVRQDTAVQIADGKSEEAETNEDNGHGINHTIMTIVVALICFIGGYVTSAFFPLDNLVEIFSKGGKNVAVIKKAVNHPARTIQKKSPIPVAAKPVQVDASSVPAVKGNAVQTTAEINALQASFDSEKYDRLNRQVRYGAYKIIGIEKTVTLRKGQSLNYLAERKFGSRDMLCYILALNGLRKNDVVKEGQKILIPKLELRHKRRK